MQSIPLGRVIYSILVFNYDDVVLDFLYEDGLTFLKASSELRFVLVFLGWVVLCSRAPLTTHLGDRDQRLVDGMNL